MRRLIAVSTIALLSILGCHDGSEDTDPAPGGPETTRDAGAETADGAEPGGPATDDGMSDLPEPRGALEDGTAPPWSGPRLPADRVPRVLMTEWRAADNRTSCAPLAPEAGGPAVSAVPGQAVARSAHFGGGWGVAWDVPDTRSAFGVAGTGASPNEDTYDEWPEQVTWSDGSEVGYGPEGGEGPKELAYLTIPGQDCLYNVWSHLGRRHLERLLQALRFVETD